MLYATLWKGTVNDPEIFSSILSSMFAFSRFVQIKWNLLDFKLFINKDTAWGTFTKEFTWILGSLLYVEMRKYRTNYKIPCTAVKVVVEDTICEGNCKLLNSYEKCHAFHAQNSNLSVVLGWCVLQDANTHDFVLLHHAVMWDGLKYFDLHFNDYSISAPTFWFIESEGMQISDLKRLCSAVHIGFIPNICSTLNINDQEIPILLYSEYDKALKILRQANELGLLNEDIIEHYRQRFMSISCEKQTHIIKKMTQFMHVNHNNWCREIIKRRITMNRAVMYLEYLILKK